LADERRYAAVIGPGRCDEKTAAHAEGVGAGLARAGFTLVTGGAFGAM
jgi:predicted Rossmann-fold nucleotide-binding protein